MVKYGLVPIFSKSIQITTSHNRLAQPHNPKLDLNLFHNHCFLSSNPNSIQHRYETSLVNQINYKWLRALGQMQVDDGKGSFLTSFLHLQHTALL